MSGTLKIFSISVLLLIMIFVLILIKKEKMSIKYGLVWIFPSFILILFTVIPGLLESINNLLGFEVASNMIFTMLIGLLMVINISLTVIVSKQKEQIKTVIQEISILKEKNKNN